MRYKVCILEDQRLLRKFCQSLDRHLGCKHAYGVNANFHGQCETCPLALAEKVMFLVNFKGMTLGEAVKATVRAPIPEDGRWEMMRDGISPGREEYGALKPNEERAAAAVILGEAKTEEDD